jgi:hypothetical protein
MFKSVGSIVGFLIGVALTVGLLLTPHLLPWGYRIGFQWSLGQIFLAGLGGLAILALTLWIAGRLIGKAVSWKEPGVIGGTILIAVVANFLYCFLVEFFALTGGWRALIALLGVPVIYGNLTAVLGKMKLREAMLNIFSNALATMGAGFIIAAIIKGW